MWTSFSDYKLTYENPIDIIKDQFSNYNLESILIGTDSEVFDNFSVYITSLVFRRSSFGSICFFKMNYEGRNPLREFVKNTIRRRLIQEIQFTFNESYHIINWIREMNLEKLVNIEMHFDINSNHLYQSALFSKQATNMAKGLNLDFKLKPESIAATSVADKLLKRKSYINNKIYSSS